MLFFLQVIGNELFFILDMTNTNVTVDSELKLKLVHLVNDKNICHIRGVQIKVGAGNIIHLEDEDVLRVGKELYKLEPLEEEMHYQIILFGDDGGNTTFNYVHKTDGKNSIK
jgi:hypothetical protein